jgi:hypothetical protein
MDKDYVCYADPTQDPKQCGSSIYVAVLFPYGVDRTFISNDGKHALGIIKNYAGERYSYLFGSAWSDYDIKTFPEWQLAVKEKLQDLRNPLEIRIAPVLEKSE